MRNEISTAGRVPIPFTCIPDLLEPGTRWLCRRRLPRCFRLSPFSVSSTRNSSGAVGIAAIEVSLLLFGVGRTVNLGAVLRAWLRGTLQTDGERIQREIEEYAALSQQVMRGYSH
jgi:hypothetical protein